MTWFRKVRDAVWVRPDDFNGILGKVRRHMAV
jgi:hypothetical protein